MFVAIASLLIFLGYRTGDTHHAFIGLFFFFVLGLQLLTGNVEYQVGETLNATVDGNHTYTVTTYTYDTYTGDNAHWMGYLLAVGGAAGMSLMLYNWRSRK